MAQPVPDWLVQRPTASRMVLAPGLVLELLAFLTLPNRRWALLTGISLIGMHRIIVYF